jgi:hypothetical protein
MNTGYEILLARINSHPEEFDLLSLEGDSAAYAHNLAKGNTQLTLPLHEALRLWDTEEMKWSAVLSIALNEERSKGFITPEQRQVLRDTLHAAQAEAFTKRVLQILLHFDDSTP